MNIFFLSLSIRRCARYHFDKHVIKMILEYTQLLSTCYHLLCPELAAELLQKGLIYKPTHINHPSTKWVKRHINHYNYVCRLALQLCEEWRLRYQHHRKHACEDKLNYLFIHPPFSIHCELIEKTKSNPKCFKGPLPQAMPDEYKTKNKNVYNTVQAYRQYYKSPYKQHLVSWKQREQPLWWSSF